MINRNFVQYTVDHRVMIDVNRMVNRNSMKRGLGLGLSKSEWLLNELILWICASLSHAKIILWMRYALCMLAVFSQEEVEERLTFYSPWLCLIEYNANLSPYAKSRTIARITICYLYTWACIQQSTNYLPVVHWTIYPVLPCSSGPLQLSSHPTLSQPDPSLLTCFAVVG